VRGKLLSATLCAALAAAAGAQDRPTEEELFGAPGETPRAEEKAPPPAVAPAQGGASHQDTEAELFGAQSPPSKAPVPAQGTLIPREKEDWLKVGGLLQLRAQMTSYEGSPPGDWPFSSPNLLDVYLDARPNDRVRGFVLGRMNYDPTVGTTGETGRGTINNTGFGAAPTTQNPGAVLDQMWLNFDLYHVAFVTAGRQHVKWGVGKFWNPTDYLHPVKRNPLAPFDVRTGTTMVKLHVPWEKRGWNFYGIALFEDLAGETATDPTNRLGRIGIGGRAEIVLGGAELGLDGIAQNGHHPRYGIDLSTGLGDFDLYSELAIRYGGDDPHWVQEGPPPPPPIPPELGGWVPETSNKVTPQLVVGGSWSYKYSDKDSFTIGVEYFYNQLGYSDPSAYPFLLLGAPTLATLPGQTEPSVVQQDPTAYQPFYVGKQYAAASLLLPKPGSWNDTNIVLSTVGNLSDHSYLSRVDLSVLVLTYLTVETFAAVHYGQKGGEFRLVLPPEVAELPQAQTSASFPTGAPVVDLGVGLRLSL